MGDWAGLMRNLQLNLQANKSTVLLLSLLKCTFQMLWKVFLFFILYPSFPSVWALIIFQSGKKVWNVDSSSHPQLISVVLLNNIILNWSYLMSAHPTPLSSLHQKGVISWAELLYSLFYLGAKAESVWGKLAGPGQTVSNKTGQGR